VKARLLLLPEDASGPYKVYMEYGFYNSNGITCGNNDYLNGNELVLSEIVDSPRSAILHKLIIEYSANDCDI
jgi:hypothetical protein